MAQVDVTRPITAVSMNFTQLLLHRTGRVEEEAKGLEATNLKTDSRVGADNPKVGADNPKVEVDKPKAVGDNHRTQMVHNRVLVVPQQVQGAQHQQDQPVPTKMTTKRQSSLECCMANSLHQESQKGP